MDESKKSNTEIFDDNHFQTIINISSSGSKKLDYYCDLIEKLVAPKLSILLKS